MNVIDALQSRITCRAFLDTPVRRETVEAILTGAARAPSGGNLQPWHVWALAGDDLAALKAKVRAKLEAGQIGDGVIEYQIYPPDLKAPYRARRSKIGQDMYALIGVAREDVAGQRAQFVRNFEMFGAPVGLFFAIDKSMQQGQWADLGMFMQSIMLLAREHGLHTAPLESWSFFNQTLHAFLSIPDEFIFFCAMGLGFMDERDPINRLRADRAPLSEFAVLRGWRAGGA